MNDCIEWTGRRLASGYGIQYGGPRKKGGRTVGGNTVLAHRVAYEKKYGEIPDGMVVCHSCDNPPCINTDHLFLGTQLENIQDAKKKGRLRQGSGHPNSKLSASDIDRIIGKSRAGLRQRDIAVSFGVSQTIISRVLTGKRKG